MNKRSRIRLAELQSSFSEKLKQHRTESHRVGGGSLSRAFHMIQIFELISSFLYQLRRHNTPNDPLREQTEDYMSQVSADIMLSSQLDKDTNRYRDWLQIYRQLWQRHMALFLMVTFLFVGSCLIGWVLATQYTAFAAALIPQQLMEMIIQKDAWFESAGDNPLLTGAFIAWNNIKVCLLTFSLSAIIGLGGMFILCYNGVFFGAIMGFCYVHDFEKPLTQFVLSHGPLELTVIVASAFAGLVYGRVFFMRPYSHFKQRFKVAGREAGIIVTGIVPWLVLAGFIESFVSPNPDIPTVFRIAVGTLAAAIFWSWTLYPARTELRNV